MNKAARAYGEHVSADKIRACFPHVDVASVGYNEGAPLEILDVGGSCTATVCPFWEKLVASAYLKAEEILALEMYV